MQYEPGRKGRSIAIRCKSSPDPHANARPPASERGLHRGGDRRGHKGLLGGELVRQDEVHPVAELGKHSRAEVGLRFGSYELAGLDEAVEKRGHFGPAP